MRPVLQQHLLCRGCHVWLLALLAVLLLVLQQLGLCAAQQRLQAAAEAAVLYGSQGASGPLTSWYRCCTGQQRYQPRPATLLLHAQQPTYCWGPCRGKACQHQLDLHVCGAQEAVT